MRILIIDDEQDCAYALGTLLKVKGYHIKTTTSAKNAINLYKSSKFDVVISDLRMPEMTGIQLLMELKKINKLVKFIIMTGCGDYDSIKSAINNGASAYLEKLSDSKKLFNILSDFEKEDILTN